MSVAAAVETVALGSFVVAYILGFLHGRDVYRPRSPRK